MHEPTDDERAREAGIDDGRQRLAEGISDARDGVTRAQAAVRSLVDDFYDVDLAEGLAGRDLEAFLADAGRWLRAAEALLPRED